MSFQSCLAKLKSEGIIDRANAERFEKLFTEMEAGFKQRFGDTVGAVMAGEETLKALDYDLQLRRRQAALQITAQQRAYADMQRYRGRGKDRDIDAVRGMMARDLAAPYMSIESRAEMLDFQAHREIGEAIDHFSRDLKGQMRNKADLMDVLRARHGEKVDNPLAQRLADAIGGVFERQRQHFNALGGDIGYDAKYGLTHKWDAARTRKVPYETWRAVVLPELDRARMIDGKTNLPFTDQGLDEALRAVYETIRTDGLSGLGVAEVGGAGKLANRRSDARFLQFRNADGWMRVNAQFGAADPWTGIIDQIHGMNRDIAMMERFGPDPNASVKWITGQMKRRLTQSDDPSAEPVNLAKSGAHRIDELWREVSGQASIPMLGTAAQTRAVRIIHGARDLTTAAKLGRATISAFFGDMGTTSVAQAFNGLPQTGLLLGFLREINPASKAERQLATDLELGMRDATQGLLGLNRYLGDSQGPAWTKVVADTSLRLSALNAVTEARQRQFGKTFLWALAREREKPLGDVSEGLRQAMGRYGIGEDDWNAMRRAEVVRSSGAFDTRAFMSGPEVRKVNPQAADKMMDMILSETVRAVQTSTAKARAALNFGNAGTFKGEASRSILQFKTFTASMMMTQAETIMARPDLGPMYGAMYAGRLLATLTLMGAAIVQTRQIAKGEDLRPMLGWEFWVDAMVAGSGMGILGDVIGSFKNQDITGLSGIISGPMVGTATDIGNATIKNAFRAARGKDTHVGRDLVDLVRKNTPGSSTWYLGPAFARMFTDQLRTIADPDYPMAWGRMRKRAADQGAPMWWEPGEMLPSRAPNLGTAVQAPPPQPAP
jgi:hypothetical protein